MLTLDTSDLVDIDVEELIEEETPNVSEAIQSLDEAEAIVEEPELIDDPGYDDEADEETERLLAEESHVRELEELSEEHLRLSLRVEELQQELKATKKEAKEVLDEYTRIQLRGPEYPEKKQPVVEADAEASQGSEPYIQPVSEDATEWRSIKTESILDGIKGIGEKKRDTILHEFPTLGHLQDARVEASKEWKQFKEKFPKGCGEKLVQQIEDAMLDLIPLQSEG